MAQLCLNSVSALFTRPEFSPLVPGDVPGSTCHCIGWGWCSVHHCKEEGGVLTSRFLKIMCAHAHVRMCVCVCSQERAAIKQGDVGVHRTQQFCHSACGPGLAGEEPSGQGRAWLGIPGSLCLHRSFRLCRAQPETGLSGHHHQPTPCPPVWPYRGVVSPL